MNKVFQTLIHQDKRHARRCKPILQQPAYWDS
jgi:hypothetical protein